MYEDLWAVTSHMWQVLYMLWRQVMLWVKWGREVVRKIDSNVPPTKWNEGSELKVSWCLENKCLIFCTLVFGDRDPSFVPQHDLLTLFACSPKSFSTAPAPFLYYCYWFILWPIAPCWIQTGWSPWAQVNVCWMNKWWAVRHEFREQRGPLRSMHSEKLYLGSQLE